ncbi:hypothetical protein [Clostridium sp. YIM B02555]|uniref:hypothetical protein n=1 Tax=Clostridium sp. YIM B02555 TaxID=2911968 RepID=UPI001EEE58EA|nr:hypothetical protein [Clostridium sp. YIM B02555]
MTVSEQEYKEMWKEIDGVIYTPKAELIVSNANGVQEFNYNIIKTADEVYKEHLNPPTPKPTEAEKQAELINNLIVDNLNMQTQINNLINK